MNRRLLFWLGWTTAALVVRVASARIGGFDGLFGQDAWAYLGRARELAADISGLRWPSNEFFWPSGYPAVVAVASLVGATAQAWAQWVPLLLGAVSVPLCGALAEALFVGSGHVAAAAMLLSGQHILSSTAAMSDVPALFWLLLAAWAMVTARGRPAWTALWGAALGAAIATRWAAVVMAPGMLVWWWFELRGRRMRGLAAAAPWCAGALVVVPQLILSWTRPAGLATGWAVDWHVRNAVMRTFESVDGTQTYSWWQGLFYALPLTHPAFVPSLLVVVGVVGVPALVKTRPQAAAFVGLWAGCGWLLFAGAPFQNFRFGLVYAAAAVLMACAGWVRLRAGSLGQKRVAVAALGVSLALMLVWTVRTPQRHMRYVRGLQMAAEQVDGALPEGAVVWAHGLTAELRQRFGRDARELHQADADAVVESAGGGRSVFWLVDRNKVRGQWSAMPLGRTVAGVEKRCVLTPIGRFGAYRLERLRRR